MHPDIYRGGYKRNSYNKKQRSRKMKESTWGNILHMLRRRNGKKCITHGKSSKRRKNRLSWNGMVSVEVRSREIGRFSVPKIMRQNVQNFGRLSFRFPWGTRHIRAFSNAKVLYAKYEKRYEAVLLVRFGRFQAAV